MIKIIEKQCDELIPYDNNARINDKAVEAVAKSIKEFGMKNPIIINKDNVIIAGHTRLKALKSLGVKTAPCIVADDLTDDQIKAFRIADNSTAQIADWNLEKLNTELASIDLDMTMFGLDEQIKEIEKQFAKEIIEDEVPEVSDGKAVTELGDIWQLGRHRLMCGDSTDALNYKHLTQGVKVDLVFTDPPYGMKKEADGVLNDNLNYDKLLEFNKQWIPHTFDALKDNGSWYCWGIDEPLMDIYSEILKPMIRENKITFRNFITWKKENDNPTMLFNGACSTNNRSFYSNEKCLFVMCGVQGFNNNSDNYFEKWEPIRTYLEGEAKKVGLNNKKLKEICGVEMYGHWFTKSQWGLITEEHYLKLQNYYKKEYGAFKKEYDELKKEYDELKKEYYKTRAYFDGTASQCIDVWVNDVTSGEERENTGGHATPKPIAICSRAIKSSSKENEIVLDVFGGSGSTLIACEQLNRVCYANELDPHWCDVIIQRYIAFKGTSDDVYRINADGTKTKWGLF